MNRVGAKMCAGCGKPLAVQPPSSPPPPRPAPPPQQPVTPRQPPAPPPQLPVSPRQPPAPPPQAQMPLPASPPPPRKPPTPLPTPARQPQTPSGGFKLSLKPWQYALIGGIVIVLCLCVLLVNAVAGIFKPGKPTPTFAPMPSQTVAPQITVLVFSPTPAPATQTPIATRVPPTGTTEPTRVPPTLTTEPSPVPKPSSTATLTPPLTATATVTPTPTLVPTDTPPNTVLDVDKKWRQQNLEMAVQNAQFANVACESLFEFDLSLENTELGEVVISWKGEDITVTDDTGKPYDVFYQLAPRDPRDCSKYKPIKDMNKTALAGKENYKIAVTVRGILPDSVREFNVTVGKVGTRIQNAKWKIVVRR